MSSKLLKILGGSIAAIAAAMAMWLSRLWWLKDALETPQFLADIISALRSVFGDFPILQVALLAVGIAGLLLATSDGWRPRLMRLSNPEPTSIGVLELAQTARDRHGWDFSDGWQVNDLCMGLAQAALRGQLVVEGKKCPPVGPGLRHAYRFKRIDSEVWSNELVQVVLQHDALERRDNFEVIVDMPKFRGSDIKYRDVHLTSRADALAWLAKEGPHVRGSSRAAYDASKKANS